MEFDQAVAELETLIATLEREGDERGLLLLELVDAIHRPALEAIMAGKPDHPVALAVLGMYDLAEIDDWVIVQEALDDVRPYIESHGGELELLGVDAGVVRLRMAGACEGCAASALTLRRGIEAALRENYPAFKEVVAEGPSRPPADGNGVTLIQLEGVENLRRPRFVELESPNVDPGTVWSADVEGESILLANVEGETYAFRNGCPVDGLPLEGGRLTEGVIVCPWHNCAFDARSGKRVDGEDGGSLVVIPVAVDGDSVRVAVNVV